MEVIYSHDSLSKERHATMQSVQSFIESLSSSLLFAIYLLVVLFFLLAWSGNSAQGTMIGLGNAVISPLVLSFNFNSAKCLQILTDGKVKQKHTLEAHEKYHNNMVLAT